MVFNIKNSFYLIVLSFLMISCKDKAEVEKNDKYSFYLLIRGPGECVYQIYFNEKGNGKIINGKSKEFYKEPFNKLYIEKQIKSFKISSKEDLDSLNFVINDLSKSNAIIGSFSTDVSRKEFYINNIKKMDVYSWRVKEMNLIEKFLYPHLPIEINPQCD